ncbi:uncharacterized protein MYCGRDRAFT_96461 [Zymoseptoria tritici IPO323]|uniref:Uncharacterized protein n=1 Tax=Zymoseptoria tritici (strain CBS 115943 / IPO323) TaxID=336722 RepID=F9XMG5_ZYMTI|nr:uncharacterized protein MYCGRDRAFT_96461 [Zymoseptoria tritici IPO323]EGP83705.1 hypothetical protein MYCGRDRAFT_96461 [Zymoseptoria tritici IPO323]
MALAWTSTADDLIRVEATFDGVVYFDSALWLQTNIEVKQTRYNEITVLPWTCVLLYRARALRTILMFSHSLRGSCFLKRCARTEPTMAAMATIKVVERMVPNAFGSA